MKSEQLSVFLENKSGRLLDVTRTLAEAQVNIRALSIADTSDFGILRMITDDNQKAKKSLKEKGFTVSSTEVIALEVEDKPGGLTRVLELLFKNDINIEYMYAFVDRRTDNAVDIIRFDDPDQAANILSENGIKMLDSKELYSM